MVYKTKANLAPYVRSSIPLVSSAGGGTAALAKAFEGIADMFDAYGNNRDAKLLASYKDEKDLSNVDEEAFYSPLNAYKAKSVVENNLQIDRKLENQARDDAKYYQDQFTNQAKNDALTMEKDEWSKKYANAGGINQGVIADVFRNKKLESREDNLYKQKQDSYNYELENRKKTDAGKTLLNDVMSGTITSLDGLKHYADSVDASSFNSAKKILEDNLYKNSVNEISSKYKTWDEFKQSEDWKTAPYRVKDALSKTKVWGNTKDDLTFDQNIKKEQIKVRTADLPNKMKEYEKKAGRPMSLTEQSAFVYEGKVPKVIEETKEKEPLTTKEAKDLDGLVKYYDTLNKLEEAYDSSYVGGLDSSLNTITPNFMHSDGHRKFNTLMNDVTLGKTSALAGTLSDKDMALLQGSGLSDTLGEEDFLESLKDAKKNVVKLMKERKNLLGEKYNVPEHYSYIDSLDTDKKPKIKTKTITKRKEPDTNNPKILTPEELEKAGIKFN